MIDPELLDRFLSRAPDACCDALWRACIKFPFMTIRGFGSLTLPSDKKKGKIRELLRHGEAFDPQRADLAFSIQNLLRVYDWDPTGTKVARLLAGSDFKGKPRIETLNFEGRLIRLFLRHRKLKSRIKPHAAKGLGAIRIKPCLDDPWGAIENEMGGSLAGGDDLTFSLFVAKYPMGFCDWTENKKYEYINSRAPAFIRELASIMSVNGEDGTAGVVAIHSDSASFSFDYPYGRYWNTFNFLLDQCWANRDKCLDEKCRLGRSNCNRAGRFCFQTKYEFSPGLKRLIAESFFKVFFPGSYFVSPLDMAPARWLDTSYYATTRKPVDWFGFDLCRLLTLAQMHNNSYILPVQAGNSLILQFRQIDFTLGNSHGTVYTMRFSEETPSFEQLKRLMAAARVDREFFVPQMISFFVRGQGCGFDPNVFATITKTTLDLDRVPTEWQAALRSALERDGGRRQQTPQLLSRYLSEPGAVPTLRPYDFTDADDAALANGIFKQGQDAMVIDCPCGCGRDAPIHLSSSTVKCPQTGKLYWISQQEQRTYIFDEAALVHHIHDVLDCEGHDAPMSGGGYELGKFGNSWVYYHPRPDSAFYKALLKGKRTNISVVSGTSWPEEHEHVLVLSIADLLDESWGVSDMKEARNQLGFRREKKKESAKDQELNKLHEHFIHAYILFLRERQKAGDMPKIPSFTNDILPFVLKAMRTFNDKWDAMFSEYYHDDGRKKEFRDSSKKQKVIQDSLRQKLLRLLTKPGERKGLSKSEAETERDFVISWNALQEWFKSGTMNTDPYSLIAKHSAVVDHAEYIWRGIGDREALETVKTLNRQHRSPDDKTPPPNYHNKPSGNDRTEAFIPEAYGLSGLKREMINIILNSQSDADVFTDLAKYTKTRIHDRDSRPEYPQPTKSHLNSDEFNRDDDQKD